MVPQSEKRELYMGFYNKNKTYIDRRINEGVEKYRKGACRIRLTDKTGKPLAGQTVKINQTGHDFKYGANIFLLDGFESHEKIAAYRKVFKEYFNLATVPFYWDTLEPVEGNPRFSKNSEKIYRRPAPDVCFDYCYENGIEAKLHCLVYENFVPAWLKGRPLPEIKEKYEERFRQIAERYSGRMYEVEVVNELLCAWDWPHRTALSDEKDIIEWAFSLARKYFPSEKLVINEAGPVSDLSRLGYRSPYFMMIDAALLKGVSIDKIGMQHHLFGGLCTTDSEEEYDHAVRSPSRPLCDPAIMFGALDIMSSFSKPLEITEVTIPTFGSTLEDEELQADMLKLWFSVWFSHPLVENVVYWNTVDGYAYVSDKKKWDENRCRGGLFHDDLSPKRAALMLKHLFTELWHTELTLITDNDGYIDFRGFYGDYTGEISNEKFDFSIHKNEKNFADIII